ncbi:MAG: ATP-binding protein, partial [Chloroflexota bacterium]
LDLSLPDAVGLDTFNRLFAVAPDLPIVVLTGLADSQTAIEAVQHGAQDYLVKGQVDADGLARSIHYAVGRHQLMRERQQLLAREQEARIQAEHAEERYRDLYARYHSLFEGGADAIIVTDSTGQVVDANPAATVLLGYSELELRDLRFDQLPANPDDWSAEHLARLHVNGRWRGEIELRMRDGRLVPVEARIRALEQPTGVVYWSSLRNISERRAVERQQRDFLAMVTHELRNPAVALRSFAQMLEMRGEYDQRTVDVIVSQARHLDRLISDVLDVAHLSAGHLELRLSDWDLVALTASAVEQCQALTEHHSIRLQTPPEPVFGTWDHDRVQQILQNLLSNAVKYSPDGGDIEVRILISASHATVEVSDHGVGIPAESQPHLFSRFYRTATARKSRAGGLGLGLYITRSLVEAHGGQITARSTEGVGSTFSFTLPHGA